MNYCPCCSESLIRQVSERGIYWFCLHCRQEMPILERVKHKKKEQVSQSF